MVWGGGVKRGWGLVWWGGVEWGGGGEWGEIYGRRGGEGGVGLRGGMERGWELVCAVGWSGLGASRGSLTGEGGRGGATFSKLNYRAKLWSMPSPLAFFRMGFWMGLRFPLADSKNL